MNFTNPISDAPAIETGLSPHGTVLLQAFAPDSLPSSTTIAGMRTIAVFSSLSSELTAILDAVGVYDLGWLTRLRMTGDDRVRWLNGMVTNSIKALASDAWLYTFLLNAQGRIQGDGDVYALPDALLLSTDAAQAPRLQAHLERFIIMDDVDLTVDPAVTALGLGGPQATALLDTVLGVPPLTPRQVHSVQSAFGPILVARGDADQYTLWVTVQQVLPLWQNVTRAGASPCGLHTVEALRILSGVPRYGVDIHEKSLAQETGQTRALNFNKGCYLGQEIVERVRSRATLNRSLACFQLDGPPPASGAALFAPTQPQSSVGELTSIASISLPRFPHLSGVFALGTARSEAALHPLVYSEGTATRLAQPPIVHARKDSTHG